MDLIVSKAIASNQGESKRFDVGKCAARREFSIATFRKSQWLGRSRQNFASFPAPPGRWAARRAQLASVLADGYFKGIRSIVEKIIRGLSPEDEAEHGV
jgi:hypothetical protein